WVEAQPDVELSDAARNALGKIATASPEDLRDRISDTGLWPVRVHGQRDALPLLALVRRAMRTERALRIDYEDEKGNASAREIWPVQIAFYENKQIIAAWCTLREAYRHFRTERIVSADLRSEEHTSELQLREN